MGRFGGTGRHFWLDSWILANIVQLGTQRFCERFLNRTNDPAGRQFDQMTQAARSGCANNAEGASRTATSKETEMKLTDVARASLAELQGDYLNWLLKKEQVPWEQRSTEAQAVFSLRLDRPTYGEDVLHDACTHILAQKRKFAPWLTSEDDVVMANALLILIGRVINMLNHQMESQGEKFEEEGGFREKLSVIRHEAMARHEQAPVCPECGAVMRKRKAKSGKNIGQEFWGCSTFPKCNGVRSL
ncbi:MAG: four helix bundle suffix domain-containing protein [Lentisphaeria bacterium]